MKQKITLVGLSLVLLGTMLHTPAFSEEDTTVYKRYDEEGAVEFSDVKRKEAEEVKVKKVPTYEAPKQKKFTPLNTNKTKSNPNQYSLKIVSPPNGGAIRSNNGDLTIEVSLSPALKFNHLLKFQLDNDASEPVAASQYTFKNVNRGQHTVSVSIVDKQGNSVQSGEPVTFQLHRHSVLHIKPVSENEASQSIPGVHTLTEAFTMPFPREPEAEVSFDPEANVEEAADESKLRRTYTITNAGTDQNPRAITGAGTITGAVPAMTDRIDPPADPAPEFDSLTTN